MQNKLSESTNLDAIRNAIRDVLVFANAQAAHDANQRDAVLRVFPHWADYGRALAPVSGSIDAR